MKEIHEMREKMTKSQMRAELGRLHATRAPDAPIGVQVLGAHSFKKQEVEKEEYEKAAEIRDKIKKLESES